MVPLQIARQNTHIDLEIVGKLADHLTTERLLAESHLLLLGFQDFTVGIALPKN